MSPAPAALLLDPDGAALTVDCWPIALDSGYPVYIRSLSDRSGREVDLTHRSRLSSAHLRHSTGFLTVDRVVSVRNNGR